MMFKKCFPSPVPP